jgi:hypothetical protein
MPAKPHRFLSLGSPYSARRESLARPRWHAPIRRRKALFKNPVEEGVVNSKLLLVTTPGTLRQHNKDCSSYY